jgi:hypothetical protein
VYHENDDSQPRLPRHLHVPLPPVDGLVDPSIVDFI